MPEHLNETTLVLAYYENPEMLEHQIACLLDLPFHLRSAIGLIVVDDGSPDAPAKEVLTGSIAAIDPSDGGLGGGLKLFRMGVDVRWNQDACRNLAMKHCETKWALLTDMDHIVLPETWRRVITGKLSWKSIYTFARVTGVTRSTRNPHPNTWLLTTDMFEAADGYDEAFAGFYGTDGDFKRRLEKVGKIEQLPERLAEITPDMVADCRTVRYERKTADDRAAIPRIMAERARAGRQRTVRGRFPWHREF